jgi:hypothetical protein
MLDFLRKEFLNQYVYSNIDEDRQCVKSVRINGRLYDKYGVDCATTAVALVYKVPVYGVKQFKTVILVGIARQNPCDSIITLEQGAEEATQNALINPIMRIEYDHFPGDEPINLLLRSYVLGIPCQFVKTTDEIKANGKNPSDYNRQKKLNKYYTEYYKDAFETINYYKQKYT